MKLAKIFLMIVLGVALVISGPAVAFARGGHGGHGGGHGGHSGGHHGGGHGGHFGGRHHFHGHSRFGFFIGTPWSWPYYDPPYFPYYRSYAYPPAVAVPLSPPVYVERGQSNDWYYCWSPQGYYPYVKECPGGWQGVSPQPSAQP